MWNHWKSAKFDCSWSKTQKFSLSTSHGSRNFQKFYDPFQKMKTTLLYKLSEGIFQDSGVNSEYADNTSSEKTISSKVLSQTGFKKVTDFHRGQSKSCYFNRSFSSQYSTYFDLGITKAYFSTKERIILTKEYYLA